MSYKEKTSLVNNPDLRKVVQRIRGRSYSVLDVESELERHYERGIVDEETKDRIKGMARRRIGPSLEMIAQRFVDRAKQTEDKVEQTRFFLDADERLTYKQTYSCKHGTYCPSLQDLRRNKGYEFDPEVGYRFI